MAAQLWNTALRRDHDDFLRCALHENVCMATDAARPLRNRKKLWAWHFIECMSALDIDWGSRDQMHRIDISELTAAMRARWDQVEWRAVNDIVQSQAAWTVQPCAVRAAPESFSKGFQLLTYSKWFSAATWTRQETFMYFLNRPDQIRAVAQFRLSSHWLQIQRGRGKQPRHERTCPHCQVVEDEVHIFECPLYENVRRDDMLQLPDNWTDLEINGFFNNGKNPGFWETLADFLIKCRMIRDSLGSTSAADTVMLPPPSRAARGEA